MSYHLFHPGNELFNVIGLYLHPYEVEIIGAYWRDTCPGSLTYVMQMCMHDFWDHGLIYLKFLASNEVATLAINENRPDILIQYVRMGWTNYNIGLIAATKTGNLPMMQLCKRLGADESVIQYAIQSGRVDAAKLAISWGNNPYFAIYKQYIQLCYDPYDMLIFLHQYSDNIVLENPTQFDIMRWPIAQQTACLGKMMEWGYRIDHTVLAVQAAASRNFSGVCKVIEWGNGIDYNAVFIAATKSNSLRIMKFIHECGASDIIGAIAVAMKSRTIELLQSWL